MIYKIFDLNIAIAEKYIATRELLKDYAIDYESVPDMEITVSDDEIEKEAVCSDIKSRSYCEMICIFRHITEEIVDYNGMFVHSAVVEKDNLGYMFTGHSRAGKTTHAIEWVKYFNGSARIINGDKPILRFFESGIYAYGSPWCGSEGMAVNSRVRLLSACFIEQAKYNSISALDKTVVFKKLLSQTVVPKKAERKIKHFDLLDRLIKEIPFYVLNCDVSSEAVKIAYNGMRG